MERNVMDSNLKVDLVLKFIINVIQLQGKTIAQVFWSGVQQYTPLREVVSHSQ